MITALRPWSASHACESLPVWVFEPLSRLIDAPLVAVSLVTGCCDSCREGSALANRRRRACSLHSLSLIPRGPVGALQDSTSVL